MQDLIKTLFDEKEMDRSLVDMGLDVRKIKLIDQTKISSAYKVLQEIEAKLQPAVGQTPQQHQSEYVYTIYSNILRPLQYAKVVPKHECWIWNP